MIVTGENASPIFKKPKVRQLNALKGKSREPPLSPKAMAEFKKLTQSLNFHHRNSLVDPKTLKPKTMLSGLDKEEPSFSKRRLTNQEFFETDYSQ